MSAGRCFLSACRHLMPAGQPIRQPFRWIALAVCPMVPMGFAVPGCPLNRTTWGRLARGELVRQLAELGGNPMLKLFSATQNFLADRFGGDRGATAVEYGLIVALIAGVCILAITTMGTTIRTWFNNVSGAM